VTSAAIAQPGRVVANMAAKGSAFVVEKGAQFALVVAAGRTLGEAGFGRFSFATNLAVLLAFVTDLGLTTWTTRALARGREEGAAVLGTGLRLRLWAAIPVVLALAGVAVAVDDRALALAVVALGVTYLARGLCDHARAVFRAHERLGDEGKLNAAIAVLGAAAGIAGLRLGAGGLGALAAGVMAGTLVGAAYGFVLLGRNYGPWAGPADRALARRMLREAAPFYLAGAFTLLYARADVLLLKPLSFDAEVGAYRAAGQLVDLVKQLPVLLMTATFPQLARGYQDSRAALVRTERIIMRLLLGGGILLGGTLALAAEPIIMLVFGPGYDRAVPVLRTLAPAVPLLFVNCGVLHFFVARDRGTLNLAFAAVMVVVSGGVNLVLDRRLGAVGAAAATVVTEAMLFVCCLYALRVLRRSGPPARGEPAGRKTSARRGG
jgi:O-antigen/teichoic acid export membrane protein